MLEYSWVGALVDLRSIGRIGALLNDGARPLVYYLPEELRKAPVEKRGERRASLQVIAGSTSARE
ncbi:hypothetical protein F0U62_06255 [Cystobacter fuscus]|uniref:hypothetical protein n=1 Tax=Cystobacter fuscus TaxID=43 RepID=UPI002B29921D|nr:hypothetical protein F0U62_06255 [Cystobacter fuscus]